MKVVRREANVHVRLSDDEKERIEKVADAKYMGVSSWLRMVALEALKRAEKGD